MCDEHCKPAGEEQVAEKVTNSQDGISLPVKDYSINLPFADLNAAVVATFEKAVAEHHVFFTQQPEPNHLFNVRQAAIEDPVVRQQQNCFTCQDFLRVYGGLVTIDPTTGATTSALWDPAAVPEANVAQVAALKAAVEALPVSGHYDGEMLHDKEFKGFMGVDEKGSFKHFSVPTGAVKKPYSGSDYSDAHYSILARQINNLSAKALEVSKTYFESDKDLKGYVKFADNVEWAFDLKAKLIEIKHNQHRSNLIWHAIATSGPGRIRFENTVGGQFVTAISEGVPLASAKKTFITRVDPEFYLRPQAEADIGNITECERIFERLNLTPAMERRALRLDEIPADAFIWKPLPPEHAAPKSLFANLKAEVGEKRETVQLEEIDGGVLTWVRFREEVLPKAERCVVQFGQGRYGPTFITTATNPDAEPLMKWDSKERRNPVANYSYADPIPPVDFNVPIHADVDIVGFTCQPNQFFAEQKDTSTRVLLLIAGLSDRKAGPGLALFPDDLRGELHPVRATIEMLSKRGQLTDRDQGCGGFFMHSASKSIGLSVVVYSGKTKVAYKIDRFH